VSYKQKKPRLNRRQYFARRIRALWKGSSCIVVQTTFFSCDPVWIITISLWSDKCPINWSVGRTFAKNGRPTFLIFFCTILHQITFETFISMKVNTKYEITHVIYLYLHGNVLYRNLQSYNKCTLPHTDTPHLIRGRGAGASFKS
jgi:hypothetical protein